MAIKSKVQIKTDITADADFTANQKSILGDVVDSYEDIFENVTTVQRDAIVSPSSGLVVYNIDTDRLEYWNGSAWYAIGQNISTPQIVKVSLSSADILALDSTPITVAAAPGAGFAIVVQSLAYRFTYGTTQYTGSYFIYLQPAAPPTASDAFLNITSATINAGADRSGALPANTGTGIDTIVENSALVLKASAAISTGDGTLDVWVTYSVIPY